MKNFLLGEFHLALTGPIEFRRKQSKVGYCFPEGSHSRTSEVFSKQEKFLDKKIKCLRLIFFRNFTTQWGIHLQKNASTWSFQMKLQLELMTQWEKSNTVSRIRQINVPVSLRRQLIGFNFQNKLNKQSWLIVRAISCPVPSSHFINSADAPSRHSNYLIINSEANVKPTYQSNALWTVCRNSLKSDRYFFFGFHVT